MTDKHTDPTDDRDESITQTTRRGALTALGLGGLAALGSTGASADLAGGPEADAMSEHRVPFYRAAESDLDSPGVVGRRVEITSGGSSYAAGDQLVDTGSSWERISAGYDSLSTENLCNTTLFASNYDTAQDALDNADTLSGRTKVILDGAPDDLSGYADALDSEGYLLSSSLVVPDYTVLENRSYVFLDDGADDNLIRNNISDGDRETEITINNKGVLDGNAANQTTFDRDTDSDVVKNLGLRFFEVDRLTIRNDGGLIRNINGWAIRPEACNTVEASGLVFDQDTGQTNQDGIHLLGPTDEVTINGVHGVTQDDSVVIAGQDPDEFMEGSGGEISDVTVDNITVNATGLERPIKILGDDGSPVEGVTLSNISVTTALSDGIVKIGPAIDTNSTVSTESVRDITINGIRGTKTDIQTGKQALVLIDTDCSNVVIDGGVSRGGFNQALSVTTSSTVDGLTFKGVTIDANDENTGTMLDIQGTVNDGDVDNITVQQSKYVFSVGGAFNGRVGSLSVDSVGGTIYNVLGGSIEFSTGAPPTDATKLPTVEGSEIYHTGAGTVGPAHSDGTDWISTVDGSTL